MKKECKREQNLIADGRNYKLQGYEKGYFIGPSLFDHVTKDMTIYTRMRYLARFYQLLGLDTYEEALKLINEHKFGNGTSVYTSDGDIC